MYVLAYSSICKSIICKMWRTDTDPLHYATQYYDALNLNLHLLHIEIIVQLHYNIHRPSLYAIFILYVQRGSWFMSAEKTAKASSSSSYNLVFGLALMRCDGFGLFASWSLGWVVLWVLQSSWFGTRRRSRGFTSEQCVASNSKGKICGIEIYWKEGNHIKCVSLVFVMMMMG